MCWAFVHDLRQLLQKLICVICCVRFIVFNRYHSKNSSATHEKCECKNRNGNEPIATAIVIQVCPMLTPYACKCVRFDWRIGLKAIQSTFSFAAFKILSKKHITCAPLFISSTIHCNCPNVHMSSQSYTNVHIYSRTCQAQVESNIQDTFLKWFQIRRNKCQHNIRI